jgi:two-component system sensor histidine kinase MtrB
VTNDADVSTVHTTPAGCPARRHRGEEGDEPPGASAGAVPARSTDRPRRPRFGLRTRATLSFGVTGLLVAIAVAGITYLLAQTYLVNERDQSALRQAYDNARLARGVLHPPNPNVRTLLSGLGGDTASTSVVQYRGEWYATTVANGASAVPGDLRRVVASGSAGYQRYTDSQGRLELAVGVPLPSVSSAYYELFPLAELQSSLGLLARSLLLAALGAALVAAAVGRVAANRLVRPLRPVTEAAEKIAHGALDTRLTGGTDADLRPLVESFNAMAAALQARVERDARFAADLGHELRSPLAAVQAAVDVVERRRDQLSPEVLGAFRVLAGKIKTFQQMVLDLLEISRIDSGTAEVAVVPIKLIPFLRDQLALHNGDSDVPIRIGEGVPAEIKGDRRRLAQVFANVMDNARRYAGGIAAVSVDTAGEGAVRIALDDAGPGVAPEEREAIFRRFTRGNSGIEAGSTSGSGLGLALVAEHLRLHRGQIWVEDAPTGGARFLIEIPAAPR